MNQVAATNLITQTFNSAFDEQSFENFVANLLNQVDRSKSFGYRSGKMIPQAFREHISTYHRPFVYYDPDGERLDVLVVRLRKQSGLDRARTMQRNFAAWYLKREHDEIPEAALIAFYHEAVPDWRFSFVQLEYVFGEEGAEEKLTPARRYSYLVGPTEPTHTAESQLHRFLIEDASNPTIIALAAAFQIETVSKQFFEEYKELFLKLVEGIEAVLKKDNLLAADFKRAEIHVPNFAKKLLGQIVFLYFVQKKGWLGVTPGAQWGSGPKDFLRRLFAKVEGVQYGNFFNDVLEPLFYEALAVQRPDDLFTIGAFTCQIPFLNGGLFEPMGGYDWQHTSLLLPNTLFSNRQSTDDDQATGILDVFDRYNFTVWEEEPLEKEVAVDPEMLGKVFENLLEVQDRKSKGAFYTPREIVHYMCQESLINYLDSSVNGEEVAVPRDDIVVLVRQGALALQQDAAKEAGLKSGDYVLPQSVRDQAQKLDDALAEIKLCDPAIGSGAFPVGMLHEIVQARRALGTYFDQPNRPTYPLKWQAIEKSIYGVDIDAGAVEIAKLRLWLSLVVDEEDYDDIQPLPNLDYKIVCGNSLLGVERDLFNNELFMKLDNLKQLFFAETHPKEKLKLKTKIDQLIELLMGQKNIFDFEVYFHEIFENSGGFNVVIGNPPYVRPHKLSTEYKSSLQKRYESFVKKSDLYSCFIEKSIQILANGGNFSFIVSDSFLRLDSFEKLRKILLQRTKISQIIDFENDVFDSATVKTCIFIFTKAEISSVDAHEIHVAKIDSRVPLELLEFIAIPQSYYWKTYQNIFDLSATLEIRKLKRKIESNSKKLGIFFKISFGLKTGDDKKFLSFELTSQQHKPLLRGRDIGRYEYKFTGEYVWYVPEKMRKHKTTARPGNKARFEQPKLLVRDTGDGLRGTFDDNNYYVKDVLIVSDRNKRKDILKALIGLLNSSLMRFYYETSFPTLHVQQNELAMLPIHPDIMDVAINKNLVAYVEQILSLKESSTKNHTLDLERKIDEIVYQLYGLSDEDIVLVEETLES